jgi:nucleoside triphosphate pyrophosphatase
MSAPPLVLASASPRRRELLDQSGVAFESFASAVQEVARPGEQPDTFAQRMAREKAADVARHLPGRFVLAADTVVVVDDVVLGKPADRDDARRMLRTLSGRGHRVLTAVALIDPQGGLEEVLVQSDVEFRGLSEHEIEDYLNTGEPFDKAGAYGLQGGAAKFVRQVRGSVSNVIGLPMDEVAVLLRRRMPSLRAPTPSRPFSKQDA